MARTQRDIVSYFPHDANANGSDTITVLQSRFGNDGYAFWFKLLEKLASTEGHFLDCRNPIKWQLLLAKAGVNEITGVEIMKLLVEMQAIDKGLWESKLIWCQKLVDNIGDVYKNRRRGLPEKPVITKDNGITTDDIPITKRSTSVEMPQSKVKESKVKESKGDKLPEFIDREIWDNYLRTRKKPTDQAKVLLVKKLSDFRAAGDDPNEVLKRSIMNGWTGIFPLDKKGGRGGTNRKLNKAIPGQESAGAFSDLARSNNAV